MVFDSGRQISTSNNIPIQIKYFLGATFNVSTSMKSIESPLSDVIQNDLQSRKEDRRSPSLSNFSSDKDKLSLGKVLYDCNFFQNNSAIEMIEICVILSCVCNKYILQGGLFCITASFHPINVIFYLTAMSL